MDTDRSNEEPQVRSLPAPVEQTGLDTKGLQAGAEIIDSWLVSLDAKQTTRDTYRRAIKPFLAWTSAQGISRPQRPDILAYREALSAEGKSAFTVNAYLTATRQFFAFLEAERLYPDVSKNVKGQKRPRGYAKEALTAEQARRLVDSVDASSLIGLRDRAIINLMIRTGLREVEISRADVGDLGKEAGELVLRVWGKGRDSKDSFVLLTPSSYSPIADYLAARGPAKNDQPLFPSYSNRNLNGRLGTRAIRGMIEDRLARAGLKSEKVSAHSLRHSTATLAILGGADIIQVKEMLRHSSVNSTLVYIHNLARVTDGAEKYVEF